MATRHQRSAVARSDGGARADKSPPSPALTFGTRPGPLTGPISPIAPYAFHYPSRANNAMPLGVPASILGIIVKGDLADLTLYTDRLGRKVWFPKAPPTTAPTPLQQIQRNRFKSAQRAWAALTLVQKAQLEDAANALSLSMTGQNLYICLALRCDESLILTLRRQSGVDFPYPACIPFGDGSSSSSASP